MDRRTFIGVAGSGLLAMSVPATAQQARQIRRTGVLTGGMASNPAAALSASLRDYARPGGNITGYSMVAPELTAKRLEILRELLPKAIRIGELVDPGNEYWQLVRKDYEGVFRTLGMQPVFIEMANPGALEHALAELTRQRVDALIVRGDPVFFTSRDQIMDFALKHALPTMAESRQLLTATGLVSYGPNLTAMMGRMAALVDKILRGAKPGDLPAEQPTKFELAINLKTAKALGLTVPQSLLLRADEVIQ
jgi:putative tryptophan/tyrosine transport system substrate-binding protein